MKKKVNINKKRETINVAIRVEEWKILKQFALDNDKSLKAVLNETIREYLR